MATGWTGYRWTAALRTWSPRPFGSAPEAVATMPWPRRPRGVGQAAPAVASCRDAAET